MTARTGHGEPGVHTVWQDVAVPGRRVRVTEVSAITVTFDVSYSTEPDAWDYAAHTRTELTKFWRHRYVPEGGTP